ncbi:MAG: Rha family transcriptional regulator [Moraxella sp.]|nr:Rha family transcriptional regulator [Moraxella sp.]
MSDIVKIENKLAFTTSLDVANGTGNEHRAILQLIKKHMGRFSKYQRVSFEMRPFATNGGTQYKRVAILDERQAYLLMTMLKNTQRVLDFKEALVDAFIHARSLLQTGTMNLLHQHAILHTILDSEKGKASDCGRGLNEWKRTKDLLQKAIDDVEAQIQPQLPFYE